MRIALITDGKLRKRHQQADCIVSLGKEVSTNKPLVVLTENMELKVYNFPMVEKRIAERYEIRARSAISEYYSILYYAHRSFSNFYFIEYEDVVYGSLYLITERRVKYFKVACALSIPIFFWDSGLPGHGEVEVLALPGHPFKVYELVLLPIGLGFAFSEYSVEAKYKIEPMEDYRDIARAFMSFLTWKKAKAFITEVKAFINITLEG